MKLVTLLITNSIATHGGAQTLRQVVLFVWLGNPIVYKSNTFNWEQGRKLVSGTLNGNSFAYNYDGNGMRYEKVVNGTTTSYYYDGTQLLMESTNGMRTWYIYGVTGIEGMIVEGGYQDTVYYYDKNTLGDIVAIRDSSGNIVATYEYDAWGKVTVMDEYGYIETSSTFIGNINPFRYRGYYYDTETGFYYLQTRYYDPTICRFINADNYELVMLLGKGIVGGFNVYSYCFNNPIVFIDDGGYWPKPFTYRGWKIRFDPPRAGSGQQYHVHVDGYGKSYAQNIDGTPHDGLTGVPDKGVRDVIEKATKGKWTWNVNKMVLGDLPRWQEGFSISSLPYHQESFSVEQLPQYQEQFSTGGPSPWQEGFSMPSLEKNNVLIYVLGGAAVVVVFGAAVYFTGGYALILLA